MIIQIYDNSVHQKGNVIMKKMKKLIILISACILTFGLASCGEKDTSPIKDDEIGALYASPDDFSGRQYEFTAQILTVESDSGTYYIQAFQDISNYERNTVIVYNDTKTQFNVDDYIKVKGTVTGEFKGENAFGGEVSAVQVEAEAVEKISAVEAFPAEETIKIDETVTKGNYSATLEKVDFTANETRVYLTITNSSGTTFSVYPDQGVLVQNGKQYENNYNYVYGDFSTEIKPGVSASGVIAYDRIEPDGFTYTFTGYDENYNELTFEFEVPAVK